MRSSIRDPDDVGARVLGPVRAWLLALLLVVNWSVPTAPHGGLGAPGSNNNSDNSDHGTASAGTSGRRALPADHARDVARSAPRQKAPPGHYPDGGNSSALAPVAASLAGVAASSISPTRGGSAPQRPATRVFDARGPPGAVA
jgi:hypothetical protein